VSTTLINIGTIGYKHSSVLFLQSGIHLVLRRFHENCRLTRNVRDYRDLLDWLLTENVIKVWSASNLSVWMQITFLRSSFISLRNRSDETARVVIAVCLGQINIRKPFPLQ